MTSSAQSTAAFTLDTAGSVPAVPVDPRILNSPRTVAVNIAILRAFVRLRRMIAGHADLARPPAAMEKKSEAQFQVVFDAFRELMTSPATKHRGVGFHPLIKEQRSAKPSR